MGLQIPSKKGENKTTRIVKGAHLKNNNIYNLICLHRTNINCFVVRTLVPVGTWS